MDDRKFWESPLGFVLLLLAGLFFLAMMVVTEWGILLPFVFTLAFFGAVGGGEIRKWIVRERARKTVSSVAPSHSEAEHPAAH